MYVCDAILSGDISILTFTVKLHGEAVRGNSHIVLPQQIKFKFNSSFGENHVLGEILSKNIFVSMIIKES